MNGEPGRARTLPQGRGPAGIYVHLPFCASRCAYCDFAVVVGRDASAGAYVAALEREIAFAQSALPCGADSVYLGGGTPSRLAPELLGRVVRAVRQRVLLEPDAEVTLEANPEDVTAVTAAAWGEAGITRLSVGVQSLEPAVLERAGRHYGPERALAALWNARAAGFRSVSADLILGLPGEPLERWRETLERIVAAGADHLSVYLLETDKNAPLARAVREGRVPAPAADALADAYEETVGVLESLGFERYEISSFARPGHRSRHNLKYWTDRPYAGFGLAAHAYLGGERRANTASLERYIAAVEEGREPVAWREAPEPPRRAREALILGLRLTEGVDVAAVERRWGVELRESLKAVWAWAERAGLVRWEGTRLVIPREAILRSNELFVELWE